MSLNFEGVDSMSKELVRQNAERYFAAMRGFGLDDLAGCFTDDAFYSHPPYDPTDTSRAEAIGGAAVAGLLWTKRGHRRVVQKIRNCVVDGDVGYLWGIARRPDRS
jgi:hypothetical protein